MKQQSGAMALRTIAHIHTDFPAKFGLPRQSGLARHLRGTIVFEPDFRNADALRGIEQYSHLWLIWQFSASAQETWSPTVRPPRLGGNRRVGVFATRSPFRPNPLGLSSVRLEAVQLATPQGPVLHVSGIDLMDGTPIYDIKPYILMDSHPEAQESFAGPAKRHILTVNCPQQLLDTIPPELRTGLLEALAQDPRPAYQQDPSREYGFVYAGFEIGFSVSDRILSVIRIQPACMP